MRVLPLALLSSLFVVPVLAQDEDDVLHGVLGDVVVEVDDEPSPASVSDFVYSTGPIATSAPERLPGLSLDLEACLNGGCVHASDGTASQPARVVLKHGDAGPVRVRLHLDCANLAEMRGIASLARVVLVRADQLTLHCPREPRDAYCEFRYWQGETRWEEELVSDFFTRMADTAWPDPEGRVDEAELTLQIDSDVPAGEYDLVAALPKELVDQYPCEEVRNHQWVESPPLRIELVERDEPVRWQATLVALQDSAKAGDAEAVRAAIASLVDLAKAAPAGVLPMTGVEAEVGASRALTIVEAATAPAPPELATTVTPSGPAGTIALTLRLPDGSPAAFADVDVAGPESEFSIVTDAEGRVVLQALEPGEYEITAYTEEATTDDLNVVLEPRTGLVIDRPLQSRRRSGSPLRPRLDLARGAFLGAEELE